MLGIYIHSLAILPFHQGCDGLVKLMLLFVGTSMVYIARPHNGHSTPCNFEQKTDPH